MTTQPDHHRTAGDDFAALRGLLLLPVSALLLTAAVVNGATGPLGSPWLFLVAAAASGGAALAIDRYYRRTFGRVRQRREMRLRAAAVIAVATPAFIGVVLTLNSSAPWSLDLPVNSLAIGFGLIMALNYAVTTRLRRDHVIAIGVLLGVSLLPVWSTNDAEASSSGLILAAIAFAVVGVLDHRHLLRRFPGRAHA